MIAASDVLKNFEYKDGFLYWKTNRSGIQVGRQAGSMEKNGYYRIKFNGKKYLTHRLIFAMHHGFMPKFIDHIDGNPKNNKIENLREATFNQNVQNSKLRINNKSGIKGISWNKNRKKWDATIHKDNKKYFLGRFDDIEIAKSVINEKRKILHGNFARFV